ncbi:hypothetical protein [Aquimarina spinulae]|uniref:hypothetical protein n=1 Tax=Aquimarina spinulae TaxID=1192023 RepID=UPI000D551550|nr:hypothetical protein [Aquimarina spinulae]
MTKRVKKIYNITQKLLFSSKKKDAESILDLYNFYTCFPLKEDNQGDISLKNGIAISKKNAADCIHDYKRTASFLRGVYNAIIECKKKFPNEELNILYAGCGPYAPLLLPLLSLFEPDNINITLLDINQASIDSIKQIVIELGYETYISNCIVADATQYQYRKNESLHMIITETMFHALTKEPQVAITQNLAPQLIEGGILIPEEISITLGYSFFSKEPFLNQYNNTYHVANLINQNAKRKFVETLFSLTKSKNKGVVDSYYFESKWYPIPENYEETPDICIYTYIKVFDVFQLQYEDSLITNPYCLTSLYNLQNKSKFKIKYSIENIPNWEITVS